MLWSGELASVAVRCRVCECFGDLLLEVITGETGKWEIVFPFSCGIIGRGHDILSFLILACVGFCVHSLRGLPS